MAHSRRAILELAFFANDVDRAALGKDIWSPNSLSQFKFIRIGGGSLGSLGIIRRFLRWYYQALCEFHWGLLRRFFMGSNSFLHKFPWSSLKFLVNHSVPLFFPTQPKSPWTFSLLYCRYMQERSKSVEKTICHQATKIHFCKLG